MLLAMILVLSIVLLLAATVMALRLNRVTRPQWVWWLLAGAFLLMALRRGIALAELDVTQPISTPHLFSEIIALAIGALFVVGVARIAPIIRHLQRSRETMKQSERRYRALFRHMFNGFVLGEIILDRQGRPCDFRYLLVNPAWEKQTGLNRKDVVGRTVREVIPDLEQAWIDDLGQVALTGKPMEIEREVRGLGRTYQCYAFSPERGRFAVVFTDTSERRRVYDELVKFKRICDAANYGVSFVDINNVVLYVNQYQAEVIGYRPDEMIGRPALDFYVPNEQELAGEIQNRLMEDGRVDNLEVKVLHRNGATFEMLYNAILLRDEQGTPQLTAVTTVDTRQIKSLELQLRQSQKMESIGQLAGGVAHDFNNFLMAILGFAEMAMSEIDEKHPTHGMLQEIVRSAERGSRLVQQLMAFSRKQKLKLEKLDLNLVIGESLPMLRSVIGPNIELVLRLSKEPVPLIGDSVQLQQILMNLAVNGRDAMDGEGWLTIESANTEPGFAPERGMPHGMYAMFAVSDTGCGIEPQMLERIFEPFFTTKGLHRGTGLGLSSVHGIVKQMGGEIVVESEMGKGSTFRIYLPRGEQLPESETQSLLPAETAQGSETILLVEDDAPVRELTRRVLERGGYRVLEADGAGEATRQFEEAGAAIDLLVTDVIMPVMNGKDLYLALAGQKPDLKVLFMSGYTDNVVLDQGISPGSSQFLVKPFAARVLLERVREILNTRAKSAI